MNLMPGLFGEQINDCDVTIAWSLAATLIVKTISGLRPMAENTEPGLDLAEHGGQGCER